MWLIAGFVLGLSIVIGHKVYVERWANPRKFGLYHLILLLGCAAVTAYITAQNAKVVLQIEFPFLDHRNLQKLVFVAGVFAFGATITAAAWMTNAVRRVAGLPQKFAIEDAELRHVIRVGKLWVNLPVLTLFVGCLLLLMFGLQFELKTEPKGWVGLLIVLGVITVSTATSWLWWSTMIPRWQVWAMRRVSNTKALYIEAVQANLLWRTHNRIGRFFARTAWWTPNLRKEAEELLVARANTGFTAAPSIETDGIR